MTSVKIETSWIDVIGWVGVVLLFAEYGRTKTTEPQLSIYDRASMSIASWIGASSTDPILLAATMFSIVLTLL
jgi:hypothetical protein